MSEFTFQFSELEFQGLKTQQILIPVSLKGVPLLSGEVFQGRDYKGELLIHLVITTPIYFYNQPVFEGGVVEDVKRLVALVSDQTDMDHYLVPAKLPYLKPLPFRKDKNQIITKQMVVKDHPRYQIMREIAEKIEARYGVSCRVTKSIRSHWFSKQGVYDLAIRIGVESFDYPWFSFFFCFLNGVSVGEKPTSFGLINENQKTIEEFFKVSNLKKVKLPTQTELDCQKFDNLFPINNGAFEAPIEGSVKVSF